MEQCQIVEVHVIEIPEGNGRKEQNDKNIWGEKMKQWPKFSNVMNNYKLTETVSMMNPKQNITQSTSE